MDFSQYIKESMLILVPVLYIFGLILKRTPKIPDWTIPWVELVLGLALGILYGGLNAESAVQGVLCAGCAVFASQLIKQTKGKE